MDEVATTDPDFTISHLVYLGPVLDDCPVQVMLEISMVVPEAMVTVKEMLLDVVPVPQPVIFTEVDSV